MTVKLSRSWADASETWRSGAWSLERRGDEFADIRFHGRVVLRSVRAVVRDRDWNTPVMHVDELRVADTELVVAIHSDGFGSTVSGTVTMQAHGDRLAVSWSGTSSSDYLTNRTGLVVLHPAHLAGAELDVVHTDGSPEHTAFPPAISPHQPILDIASLAWNDDGMAEQVTFSGDTFEMEDQRNWTDASYKTYSRPLALPFPYTLREGEERTQSIEVRASVPATAPAPPPLPSRREKTRIELVSSGTFPPILTSASTAPDPAPAAHGIGDVLLIELDLASTNWHAALARATRTGLGLDARLILPQDDADELTIESLAALDAAVDLLTADDLRRVAAFSRRVHTSRRPHVDALRAALTRTGSHAQVLAGARSHFTELNRERSEIPDGADGIVFSSTPLFHALGTEQLVESVAVQRLTARQAVEIAAGKPLHIGPVTLRPRFNNVATTPQPSPARTDLTEGYGAAFTGATDDRQTTPELAAWVVASTAALAVPGVASLTFFEDWGPRGLLDADGRAFPAAEAVKALAALAGTPLLSADSPDGLVWAIGSGHDEHATVLVTNLSRTERTIEVVIDGRVMTATVTPFGWAALHT